MYRIELPTWYSWRQSFIFLSGASPILCYSNLVSNEMLTSPVVAQMAHDEILGMRSLSHGLKFDALLPVYSYRILKNIILSRP